MFHFEEGSSSSNCAVEHESQSGRSALRYRPGSCNHAYAQAGHILSDLPTPQRRATLCQPEGKQTMRRVHIEKTTGGDSQVAPAVKPAHAKRPRSGKRPWLAVSIITAGLFFALWLLGTAGASIFVTHLSDPGHFGVLHGEAITANFVESQTTPVTVIGTIIHDQVKVIVINGNNSKLYTGPDLSANGFPDPDAANVQLQAGSFVGGHLDLKVTIQSDQFPTPFSRFSVVTYLYGNGDGTFKAVQQ